MPPHPPQSLDFSALQPLVANATAPAPLTTSQKNDIWQTVFDVYQAAVVAGRCPAEAVNALEDWILFNVPTIVRLRANKFSNFPEVERTRGAIKSQLYRKIKRQESGKALDMRTAANKLLKLKRALSEGEIREFRSLLVGKYYGDIDTAWRECLREKIIFNAETVAKCNLSKTRHTRCPKRIRRQIGNKRFIKKLVDYWFRPRHAKLNGAYAITSHDDYFAGDIITLDDLTVELYYAPPPGSKEKLLRGQFLAIVDSKSKLMFDFVQVNDPAFSQVDVRALFRMFFKKHKLPRIGIHMECGLFKSGKFVGGRVPDIGSGGEINFIERLGLRPIHSIPGNARGKMIENVYKLFQNHTRGELHYCGPAEGRIKFEHSNKAIQDVLRGRKTAREAGFPTVEERKKQLEEIVEIYNNTHQYSDIMGGFMTPNEAWEKLQPRDRLGNVEPMQELPKRLHWLFEQHIEPKEVTRNGIYMPQCGGLTYRSEVTGRLFGESVMVYFDPENPERIRISNLKQEEDSFDCVPLAPKIPRFHATPEQHRQSVSSINSHENVFRRVMSDIKPLYTPPSRQIIVDEAAVGITRGLEFADSQARAAEAAANENRNRGADDGRWAARELEDFFQKTSNPED